MAIIKKTQKQMYKDFLKTSKVKALKGILNCLYGKERGLTTLDLIKGAKTTLPHRCMTTLRREGFNITKAERNANGLNYYRWILK